MGFNTEELQFLKENGITHVKHEDNTPIGVTNFITTWGLVTGYEPHITGAANYHRFCYPKGQFTQAEVTRIAQEWDGVTMPAEGWVKYKGAVGEFAPGDGFSL